MVIATLLLHLRGKILVHHREGLRREAKQLRKSTAAYHLLNFSALAYNIKTPKLLPQVPSKLNILMKKRVASAKGSAISANGSERSSVLKGGRLTGDTVVSTVGKPSEKRPGIKK